MALRESYPEKKKDEEKPRWLMLIDYFVLALKNLRRRRLRSLLTMLGIVIGIAAIISLISLGAGLQKSIVGQFSDLGNDKLVVENTGAGFGPPGSTAPIKLNDGDVKLIENTPGVKLVVSRLIRIVRAEFNEEIEFFYVASIPKRQESIDLIFESLRVEIEEGKKIRAGELGSVVIGQDIKKEFAQELKVGDNLIIREKYFKINGILEKTSSFQINGAMLMAEDDLKEISGIDDEIDLILVQVNDEKRVIETAENIEKRMRRNRGLDYGEEDFSVTTPLKSFEAVNNILNIINIIFFGIASLSLIIGGIGIANTMYTSVLERTKEIGVMKAIGARNRDVLAIFIIESGFLGFVGGVIGVVIGLGLAFGAVYVVGSFLGSLVIKAQISFVMIIFAIGFATIVGLVAGVLPALQASWLKPVEALRK